MAWTNLLLCLFYSSVVLADFGNFGNSPFMNNNFNQPSRSFRSRQHNQLDLSQDQAGGNSAAAGNAGTRGGGSASSINQANHEASRGHTSANALSANTATGWDPSASGAASADGSVSGQRFHQNSFNDQRGRLNFRKKRQYGFGGYGNNGFGGFGGSASGNSIGGGSANYGNVFTQNTGYSQANPFGSTGFGAGSAGGSGYGVNIFNAATSNAQFGGRR